MKSQKSKENVWAKAVLLAENPNLGKEFCCVFLMNDCDVIQEFRNIYKNDLKIPIACSFYVEQVVISFKK